MTLIKSLLLGSAAGIVAVATAQAADLPTRKAAPVEYVRVCNVGGITGWTLPGSDTCVKLSGYITAQVVGGNLNTQYAWGTVGEAVGAAANTPGLAAFAASPVLAELGGIDPRNTQRVLLAASPAQGNTTFYRPETGWSTRANLSLDIASNTAYGPLLGHAEVQGDVGNGLDSLQGAPVNNIFYVNTAYLTWAGITAGKAASFFSFVGGGDNYANFFSPDRKGFNEPLLLAYTASFGGGFTATISAESPAGVGASGGGTTINGATGCAGNGGCVGNPNLITFGGQKWPDIVGALHVKQGWGEAQLSGVIHNVNVSATGFDGAVVGDACGPDAFPVTCNGQQNHVGWAIDAGVKINLQGWGGMFAAGDDLLLTGVYSQSAVWYSGLLDGMWGENGQTNGNGQPMFLADAFFNPVTNQWATPRAWSVSALLEHHWTPTIYTDLEGSIGGVQWSNQGGGCSVALPSCLIGQAANGALSPRALSWILGADLGWNPVTNLNFDLELMYQGTTQTAPSGFLGTVYNTGGVGGAVFVPGDWRGNSSGFAGRLRITRYF
ncbi:MAG TPA: porin [Roseiarcus sp.]